MIIGIAALDIAVYSVFLQPAPAPQIACQEWITRPVEIGGDMVQQSYCTGPATQKQEG